MGLPNEANNVGKSSIADTNIKNLILKLFYENCFKEVAKFLSTLVFQFAEAAVLRCSSK